MYRRVHNMLMDTHTHTQKQLSDYRSAGNESVWWMESGEPCQNRWTPYGGISVGVVGTKPNRTVPLSNRAARTGPLTGIPVHKIRYFYRGFFLSTVVLPFYFVMTGAYTVLFGPMRRIKEDKQIPEILVKNCITKLTFL